MDGYEVRWRVEGITWKTILDHIQPTVESLARALGAELTRERGDAPELELQWYASDDIARAMQILIIGPPGVYELHIGGSAWKDFDSPRERRWRSETLAKIQVPPDPRKLDLGQLADTLKGVAASVSGWTERDLINRADLPPRPPNVTSSMVRGRYVP